MSRLSGDIRVIVCGGRDFNDKILCFETLEKMLSEYTSESVEIVSGHARGADTFGEEYAKMHGIRLSIFKADWKLYGKSAGPVRNSQMLKYASEETPVVIAFWNGASKGTKNMIEQSRAAGATVHVIMYKG